MSRTRLFVEIIGSTYRADTVEGPASEDIVCNDRHGCEREFSCEEYYRTLRKAKENRLEI